MTQQPENGIIKFLRREMFISEMACSAKDLSTDLILRMYMKTSNVTSRFFFFSFFNLIVRT